MERSAPACLDPLLSHLSYNLWLLLTPEVYLILDVQETCVCIFSPSSLEERAPVFASKPWKVHGSQASTLILLTLNYWHLPSRCLHHVEHVRRRQGCQPNTTVCHPQTRSPSITWMWVMIRIDLKFLLILMKSLFFLSLFRFFFFFFHSWTCFKSKCTIHNCSN